jgi:hypothetical protein
LEVDHPFWGTPFFFKTSGSATVKPVSIQNWSYAD